MTARELMTDYLGAARRGDWDTAFGYFADDIVMHVPGRSRFAGDRRGKEAAVGYIQAIREHYGEGGIELEWVDMLDGDDRDHHLRGRPIRGRRAHERDLNLTKTPLRAG